MRETINKYSKKGFGLMQSLAIIVGYSIFCLLVTGLLRWLHKGSFEYTGIEYPEIIGLILMSMPIILSIAFTFSSEPLWLWIEKIKDRFKKDGSYILFDNTNSQWGDGVICVYVDGKIVRSIDVFQEVARRDDLDNEVIDPYDIIEELKKEYSIDVVKEESDANRWR